MANDSAANDSPSIVKESEKKKKKILDQDNDDGERRKEGGKGRRRDKRESIFRKNAKEKGREDALRSQPVLIV